ncbi:MAG: Gfo/Idh/MocA family protein [Nitrospiraceae bacterium]
MPPLGIGLIGLGRHGLRYARHLLEPLPHARLVAVCRRDVAQGSAFADEHALRFFQDYRDLLAANEVQAAVVVTPPSLTYPICMQAVKAGKPLLIEKPLACTSAEALAMVAAAESSGVPLMTAQTLRYDPSVLALKAKLVEAGRPRYVVLTTRVEPRSDLWNNEADYGGRGVLLEIGIHLLDLIRFLTGEEIADVRCEMDRSAPEQPESRALVSLRTTGALACMIDVSRVGAGRTGRAEWIGEDGQLIADWVERRLRRLTRQRAVDEWTIADHPTIVATLSAFVEALQRGTPMPISGRDGLKAVEAADACYESAGTGEWVRLTR